MMANTRTRRRRPQRQWFFATLLSATSLLAVVASASSPPAGSSSGGIVLRVRLQDGTMERLQVPDGAQDKLSLQEALKAVVPKWKGLAIKSGAAGGGGGVIQDPSQTLEKLGLKHGSLLSIVSSDAKPKTLSQKKKTKQQSTTDTDNNHNNNRWDPFPDLAKDYQTAIRKSKTRRAAASGLSYQDLASIQSALHVVEPQAKGPLLRLYMCPTAAERFQAAGISIAGSKNKKKTTGQSTITSRCGLLLGTFARERVETTKKVARTSLSSQPTEQDFCKVAKVQVIWEAPPPPSSSSSSTSKRSNSEVYDATGLLGFRSSSSSNKSKNLTPVAKAVQVAEWLGLEPVGFIFTYQEDRHAADDSLPVFARDVDTAARLQIENMKAVGRTEGARFVTLAMDAKTGATEAFQLSDVSVQMVAEDMIVLEEEAAGASTTSSKSKDGKKKKKKKDKATDSSKNTGRFAPTKHTILVDGQETQQLDAVLCLVNTAMLTQPGSLGGKTVTTKKNGSLTNKARKALVKRLAAADDSSSSDADLLQELSNFHTLVALYDSLGATDCQRLCQLVRKWTRGQKKGTVVDASLRKKLRVLLEH